MSHSYMTTIGEIAEVFDGPHATPKKLPSGPYFLSISSLDKGRLDLTKSAFLSEEDFKKWTKRVTPKEGDLLFSYETRLGEAALMPAGVRACLGRRMGLLRFNKAKVMPEYALYAYLSPAFQQTIKANTLTGATVDRLSISEFPNFPIRIPPLEEQKKVADLLGSIDKKIALNNSVNTELEAMAKTLYDYWFVQFDFPDANGKPYKTSGGKMEYNATLKREIPVGWNDSILGEFIELERGVTYSKEDVKIQDNKDTIGVLRATNVTGNAVDIDDLVLIPSCKASTSQMLRKFDVLIVMSSGSKEHVGKNGVYYFEKPNAFGAFCSKITPNSKFRYFINTFLQSEWFKSYINNQCMGTNINNLTNTHITKCEIICPASDVIELFENKMMPIYSKLASNTQENSRLTKLREWLLPLLMNGQVTVK